jgi:hypothetical protein
VHKAFLPRCILWLQSDQIKKERRGKDSLHHTIRRVLLSGHAFRPEKRRSNLPAHCLRSQIGCHIQVYIDDVVITTRKEESLINDLTETFDNLNRYKLKLKLKPTKCSFGVSTGQLLGFLVSARGIEANLEKIQAILTMGKSTKLHDVQKLAGRVAALSRFVARLGEKALPFYALMKKSDDKFEWTEEADVAFAQLKKVLSTPPVLVAPKEKRTTTTIHCSNTSSGEYSIGSRKKRGRKSSRRSEASLFHQRSTLSNKTKVPALSKACIQRLHNSSKTTAILCGAPNYSGQQSTTIQYIEQPFSNRTCLFIGN